MMRHDSGKVLSSILKYLLKLLFVCLLLGILYYSCLLYTSSNFIRRLQVYI